MTGIIRLPITLDEIGILAATAARAPSIHNSQPWRFRVWGNVLELHADHGRKLRHTDPDGREMLISCGAALYGLRLGIGSSATCQLWRHCPPAGRRDHRSVTAGPRAERSR